MSGSNEGIARAPKSIVKLQPPHLDALPLPNGRTVGQVDGDEFTQFLVKNGVPGASHENGKQANAEAYDRYLAKIRNDGAERAVADWLTSKRN
jgi:hypothetical protein